MSLPVKTCILIVNLGTPDSPTPGAVGRYLREFLGDGRVIDVPWLPRKILVNGIIAPIRRFKSAREYKKVWTEEGSPLLLYGQSLQRKLQARMDTEEARRAFGGEVTVELAMRYQHPSMDHVMARMEKDRYDRICVLPLYAQYASATTGSTLEKAFKILSRWYVIPEVVAISQYWDFEGYLNGFVEQAAAFDLDSYDHILFSYHGLPERQVDKIYEDRKCANHSCEDEINDENLQAHADKRAAFFADGQCDISVIPFQGRDKRTGAWTPGGMEEAQKRCEAVFAKLESGELTFDKALEQHTEFFSNDEKRGLLGMLPLNQLRQQLRENEFTQLLDGFSIAEHLFFDAEVGKTIGPVQGPESWLICRVNSRTPPRRTISVKVERERELVREDFITYRFLEWANGIIAKAKFE